jgi:general secretion pathway protein G
MKGDNKSVRKLFQPFSKGFTLIELLVVLAILGLLAGVVLVTVNPVAQLQKSNDARRKGDLESLQRALELYYQDTGSYPKSSTSGYLIMNGTSSMSWGTSWSPYMTTLPKDPTSTNSYVYFSPTGNQSYYLYANLQRGSTDPQACNAGGACSNLTTNSIPATACGGTCNYGVTSPNVSP